MLKRLDLKVSPWISKLTQEKNAIVKDVSVYEQAVALVNNPSKLEFLKKYPTTLDSLYEIASVTMHPETV